MRMTSTGCSAMLRAELTNHRAKHPPDPCSQASASPVTPPRPAFHLPCCSPLQLRCPTWNPR
ncbi:uncharacterized protein B0H18DRAFT_1022995 [Fomitopsis serialis]|uniref:uncharacterized protein n=1 Tax=Fomitopsis serialis TaxID=139415 RepID=UPI00200862BF|nr:uncharacterized protein B0H18DRAFT_1022995 [Neoantrodia serialis]KAH9920961.1 hypothetical protein B0H18DRAFT_1022995 [Neoantrodia serialis]